MGLLEKLRDLDAEVRSFECRPKTLVPDLVLWALAIDVYESGKAVHQTVHSDLPHKAYPNARLVFDGAQQALVLATHEDYESAGSRAWVYFESRDATWRADLERKHDANASALTSEQWLERRVAQMAKAWDSASVGQGSHLEKALWLVRREARKRPDNWLHEKMTSRQHRAYAIFAAAGGAKFTEETATLNQSMYEVLCRETHARPRLDSFAIAYRLGGGAVRVELQGRDLEQARRAVTAGAELSIAEAAAALRWQRLSKL